MLTVANAATKELSRPLVPMLSVKNTETSAPSILALVWVTAKMSIAHMAATMVLVALMALPAGMRRFLEPVSALAVVPATMMPTTPIVKL